MMNSGLRRLLSGAVALMLLGCSSALADTATVTARKLILREKSILDQRCSANPAQRHEAGGSRQKRQLV